MAVRARGATVTYQLQMQAEPLLMMSSRRFLFRLINAAACAGGCPIHAVSKPSLPHKHARRTHVGTSTHAHRQHTNTAACLHIFITIKFFFNRTTGRDLQWPRILFLSPRVPGILVHTVSTSIH